MNFSAAELTGIVGHYLWPLARIGAMVSLAPIFGTRTVPAKIKIILSFAIVVTVAPVIETPTQLHPFSLEGLEILAKEMIIGGMIGFAVPVIGQFYTIMATLLFLAMNGHLLLIEMVANSFHSLPVGAELSRGVLLDFVLWGKWLFIGALMIAMPAVVALLIVNIAFGVMTRASPQLNIFAIGFPITIGIGFVIMIVTLSYFSSKFTLLVEELFLFLQRALV